MEATDIAPVSDHKRDADHFWALDGLKERIPDPGAVLFAGTVTLPTGEHYDWQEGRTTAAILDADWTEAGTTLTALAHPIRLLLLREILGGARTTAELGAHEQLGTTGQLYHHLRQLVSAGWLRSTTRGQYTVPPERVIPILTILTICNR
ncbi:helix-turn-helix domain-containing protein [Actinoallomurus iriomotensis]|uniref:Transcriptional regulator n=1 Tax=Actinoallomurus iriomotensis TaxID=478107 RepID=A0A9W6W2P4_9ACTN|nr:helix-turn-helix domain-containing protein [Actinoallomurus iriomotensis]GLY88072.1 transcriptional regulator [Actinoallomurus iriomotensis]